MSQDFGSFQILIKGASDAGAITSGEYASYNVNLSGNYRLTLKSIQIHIYPEIATANTIPIEIASPNFTYSYGPVKNPTIIYPMDANNKFQGNFDMTYIANLQSNMQIQLRNATTKAPFADLKYAVLNWNYEKLSY